MRKCSKKTSATCGQPNVCIWLQEGNDTDSTTYNTNMDNASNDNNNNRTA